MKEFINNVKEGLYTIKELAKEDPDLALITVISLVGIATTFALASYDNKRLDLAEQQRDNPSLILDLCGEDLSDCYVENLSKCIDFVYARDFSYCAGGYEILPLYLPKSEQ